MILQYRPPLIPIEGVLAVFLALMCVLTLLLPGCISPTPRPLPQPPAPHTGAVSMLIVEESHDRFGLPQSQQLIFKSTQIRDYLDQRGARTTDANTSDYRVIDQDENLENEHQFWRDGMARPRKSLPWLIITNGRRGCEGPLPATEQEVLALLKKYGG